MFVVNDFIGIILFGMLKNICVMYGTVVIPWQFKYINVVIFSHNISRAK
jgi:hypothetical protein